MPNVTPGYTFTGASDPITHTKLNLVAQPAVNLATDEIVGVVTTESFGATITVTIGSDKALTRLVACTGSTASTLNASTGGTAGQRMSFVFSTDATGGNVITYGTNFRSVGTHTLTGASKLFTSSFVSNGTYWCETGRTAALS